MQSNCAHCGDAYDAKRAHSRFCGPVCRRAALRVKNANEPDRVMPVRQIRTDGDVYQATLAELSAVGREDCFAGRLALTLASRVDDSPGTGAALLAKQLLETMKFALEGTKVKAVSRVDELRARRDDKRIG